MSELLYMFGELDERVRPLMFCVRRWANSCGLTNPSPGRWITNFSLTCLVIFFLQNLEQPILPTINSLFRSASQEDVHITEDGINCSFTRDFKRTGFHCKNKSQINELLLQFFEFYSQFDFHNRALSLNEGRDLPKPDHSALYIINPLEQILNVSKNVSLEECERLRIEIRNGAWLLESEIEYSTIPKSDKYSTSWGILNLFKSHENTITRPNFFLKPRMMEIKDLFDRTGTDNPTPVNGNSSTKFKNLIVKKQVQNIKSQARTEIKQMHLNATTSSAVTMTTTTPIKKTLKSKRSR
ncbi:poly(A) RNA polymerase, mitochondrial isoform X2 [Teleopsis dalmanni]|nr:poly(A) RNA polymerase, mitochondrial isoform X2 [Teleopsis dalmanni]